MAGTGDMTRSRRRLLWRVAPWLIAAVVMLLPLAAMRLTNQVTWTTADFAILAVMLLGACGAFELAARASDNVAYRAAVGVSVVAAFVLIWITLAVGIIGSEDHPANLLYGGVLAIGLLGALIARFRPYGMTRALAVMALAQALVGAIALIAGWGATSANGRGAIVVLTGVFVWLWLLSAWLFRTAARDQTARARAVTT